MDQGTSDALMRDNRRLKKVVFGNGDPGLKGNVDKLQDNVSRLLKLVEGDGVNATGLVGHMTSIRTTIKVLFGLLMIVVTLCSGIFTMWIASGDTPITDQQMYNEMKSELDWMKQRVKALEHGNKAH